MRGQFPALIFVRTEPELRENLQAVATREKTTVAELLRRELRVIVAKRLDPDDNGPAPFRPDRGQRVAA
jgi:hypothetical protein